MLGVVIILCKKQFVNNLCAHTFVHLQKCKIMADYKGPTFNAYSCCVEKLNYILSTFLGHTERLSTDMEHRHGHIGGDVKGFLQSIQPS